jgi:hypothetical protein
VVQCNDFPGTHDDIYHPLTSHVLLEHQGVAHSFLKIYQIVGN